MSQLQRIRTLLDRRLIDAVIVCTPASTDRALMEHCLDAGLGVLVEKPLAATSEDAEAMIQMAERRGRILIVGRTSLFNPQCKL